MCYNIDTDSANIVIGFKDIMTNPEIFNHIISENVETVFIREIGKKGGGIFIPTGEIDGIGVGILAPEIQQT
tara:strand:- start:164 stop:379 length:216 start_codon:yes stop_codon:yes gene_type:complete